LQGARAEYSGWRIEGGTPYLTNADRVINRTVSETFRFRAWRVPSAICCWTTCLGKTFWPFLKKNFHTLVWSPLTGVMDA